MSVKVFTLGLRVKPTCGKMPPWGGRRRRSQRMGNLGCSEPPVICLFNHSLRNISVGQELFELSQFSVTIYFEMNSLIISPV